ncbi:MAG: hypothetical protein ABIZ81_00100 [Opitutaceae bacterium]
MTSPATGELEMADKNSSDAAGDSNAITKALRNLVSRVPTSTEPASEDPNRRAGAIASSAAVRAAAISGAFALPPGPLGLATILPDLISIWRLQQSMVADIAAAFGKSAFLRKETMIYCLFKQGGAALLRDLVARAGERFLIRHTASRTIEQTLEKIGVRVTQRVMGKSLSRLIPIAGAVMVGTYAYRDTARVAATAIELFSRDLQLENTPEG